MLADGYAGTKIILTRLHPRHGTVEIIRSFIVRLLLTIQLAFFETPSAAASWAVETKSLCALAADAASFVDIRGRLFLFDRERPTQHRAAGPTPSSSCSTASESELSFVSNVSRSTCRPPGDGGYEPPPHFSPKLNSSDSELSFVFNGDWLRGLTTIVPRAGGWTTGPGGLFGCMPTSAGAVVPGRAKAAPRGLAIRGNQGLVFAFIPSATDLNGTPKRIALL
jgi:hypothetical protein